MIWTFLSGRTPLKQGTALIKGEIKLKYSTRIQISKVKVKVQLQLQLSVLSGKKEEEKSLKKSHIT